MAKYQWNDAGSKLTITLDDAEGAQPDVVMDMDSLSESVVQAAARFGMQTALRNSTAGKMDDLADARKALIAKATVFNAGVWAETKEQKAKAELTEAEQADVIADVIVQAKQAKGDKRAKAEILAAFGALDAAKQKAAIESVQKLIDKALKTKLKQKREAAKAGGTMADF